MAVTIDQLNIELTANSQEASSAIDDLVKTMERLKSSLGPLANVNIKTNNTFKNQAKDAKNASNAVSDHANKTDKASKSVKKFTDRMAQQISKTRTLAGAFKSVANTLAGWFNESNSYVETLNLFNVTMGEGADEARAYAESVSEVMGIDPAEWMQNQGVFKNLIAGFGVASEEANLMSQNLTQLSYDMASFFNTDVETAFDKLSSAMSGQVKGLREFGIDTTVATLQEYALFKGIDESVRSMSQAEKSLLRYNYIMEQSTHIQGDMARTIATPANALRILDAQLTQMKRSLGNIVSVIVVKFIPYVQAMVQIIAEAAAAIAKFFGFSTEDFTSGTKGLGDVFGIEDAEEDLEGVSGSIKKIKKQLMGFDELNIISNPETDSGGGGGASGGGAGFEMDPFEYDFLKNLDTSRVDEIKEKMYEVLKTVGAIAAGILAWKLSSTFLGQLGGIALGVGVALIVDGITDVFTDGLSWESVIKGAIGGALVGASIGFKFGGAGGAVLGAVIGIGVTLIVEGIASMISEGVNAENIVTTVVGALTTIGGIIGAVKMFRSKTAGAGTDFEEVGNTIDTVNTGTSNLATKLKNLATTLGWGLVIIAEVAAAVLLVVGAIALLGLELQGVIAAWKPIQGNGKTIATAMTAGTAVLVSVGVAAKVLGDKGKTIALNLAAGLGMLLLISANADLFLGEIWLIGTLLTEILDAWIPVNCNGDAIATDIAIGTALLIGIGVVAAALGAATVASAGALPLAIALGTALLVELGIAFVAFCDSLILVANKLSDDLAPAFEDLNDELPDLSDNMSDFTDFMTEFCEEVIAYTAVSAIAGIAATIDKVISFFTTDPVQRMSDEVKKQNGQFEDLIVQLEDCIPDMEEAIELVKEYNDLMEDFSEVSGGEKPSLLTFLSDIVTGVWDTIKNVINTIIGGIEKLANGVIGGINGMINALNKIQVTAPDWLPEIGGKTFGFNIGTISTISIPRLAEGGIVGEGQMFIAREAGPELVGTIGNKTAVANNDQIISGIESGVYRAMMAAQASGGSGSQTIRIINEIDGDVVGEKVIQYHNGKVMQTGVTPLLV